MTTSNTADLDGTIFISDNLPFLKSLDTESVDLVCIDPPFAKNETFTGNLRPPLNEEERRIESDMMTEWGVFDEESAYNLGIEYPDQDGRTAKFRDIFRFDRDVYEDWMDSIGERSPGLATLIEATRYTHSDSTAAYIAFMAERMLQIRRILNPTGSVYLHCDHAANAYLRQMMDAVFGHENFLNEITWLRTATRKSNMSKSLANDADTILRYSKDANQVVWNADAVTVPYDLDDLPDRTARKYSRRDEESGRLFQLTSIAAPAQDPNSPRTFEVMGVTRTWRWSRERIEREIADGRIVQPGPGMVPRYKRYLDEQRGLMLNNVWADLPNLNSMATERTGYPTQKPQALARRIIEASSNLGDLVLDCFAGCAYVPVAAQLTGRRWIACDMSPRAWTVIRRQFHKHPQLGILTEGEIAADSNGLEAETRLETANRVIRVRGPHELPTPSDAAERDAAPTRAPLPRPKYKVRPFETDRQIWDAFVEQYGTTCWYCGAEKVNDRRELQLDHVEPNTRDGTNDDCWNRALACVACNSDKRHTLTPAQTIHAAHAAGRIATPARMREIKETFASRRRWAKERWERIRPKKTP